SCVSQFCTLGELFLAIKADATDEAKQVYRDTWRSVRPLLSEYVDIGVTFCAPLPFGLCPYTLRILLAVSSVAWETRTIVSGVTVALDLLGSVIASGRATGKDTDLTFLSDTSGEAPRLSSAPVLKGIAMTCIRVLTEMYAAMACLPGYPELSSPVVASLTGMVEQGQAAAGGQGAGKKSVVGWTSRLLSALEANSAWMVQRRGDCVHTPQELVKLTKWVNALIAEGKAPLVVFRGTVCQYLDTLY
ncbi:nucleolar complex protein 2, partial [Kipferlia bialata]